MRILEKFFGITRNRVSEVIAIDVGTASLSAALAKKGSSVPIEVVSVLRYSVDFVSSHEGLDNQRRALYLMKKNLAQLFVDAHTTLPGAEAIEISVSEPFFQAHHSRTVFPRESPHNRITREELDSITLKLSQDTAGTPGPFSQSLRVVRNIVQRGWINGYELKDPVGYRGAELEIEFEALLISRALHGYLEEFRTRWFPRALLRYHTDPEMLEYALFESSSLQLPALLLDIGGEATSIVVISDGHTRTLCGPVFFGVRTLERRIMEFTRCSMEHAESVLRRYTSHTMDSQEEGRIAPILESAVEEWMASVAQSFRTTRIGAIRSLFFSGQGRDIPLFRRTIERRIHDLTSSPAGLYELTIPLDHLFPPKSLHSGGDSILALLLLHS